MSKTVFKRALVVFVVFRHVFTAISMTFPALVATFIESAIFEHNDTKTLQFLVRVELTIQILMREYEAFVPDGFLSR